MRSLKPSAAAAAVRAAFPRPAPRPVIPQKLSAADVLKLEIAHTDAMDRIARGQAGAQELWDFVANCLTWSRVADLLELGQDDMGEQLLLALRLIGRWKRTGRVGFDGPDYQLAKHGVDVMDALARQVDQGTARDAAVWTEARLAEMQTKLERIAA